MVSDSDVAAHIEHSVGRGGAIPSTSSTWFCGSTPASARQFRSDPIGAPLHPTANAGRPWVRAGGSGLASRALVETTPYVRDSPVDTVPSRLSRA